MAIRLQLIVRGYGFIKHLSYTNNFGVLVQNKKVFKL